MEGILDFISGTNLFWIYTFLFFGSYVENLLPPVPGDTVVVFGAYLVGIGTLRFDLALLTTTLGSIAGFMTMYGIGVIFGRKIVDSARWSFFSSREFEKIESWFEKYGYKIVAANRFFSGARALVSLFAGVAKLNIKKVFTLALVSCILWNTILVYAGSKVGENWESITDIISKYNIVMIAILASLLIIVSYRWYKRKNNK